MHILEDRQDRQAARRRLDQPPQSSQHLLLALLRRKIEPRISSIDAGQGEQLGNKRCVIGRSRSVRKHGLKLVELRRGIVLPFEPRGALDLGDDRMERAARVMGRAEVTQAEVRLDPEDLREVLVAYQTYVTETVTRFGGFVAGYMGDGVLVYFGYPQAHEHAAERAACGGLALVRGLSGRD
ncbi:MAG TPA: hypothetical protein VF949_09885, partial [Reyranella sp.]